MGPDAFYTPSVWADTLVQAAGRARPRVVLDPATGQGSLLRSARVRWPGASLVGTDIALDHQLELRQIGVCLTRCDFLDVRSRARSVELEAIKGKGDLVLMNPPFPNSRSSHV